MKLITFEGINGCGKSTQLQLLAERLWAHGMPHVTTREPYTLQARQKLLYGANLTPEAELDLFLDDRSQHYTQLILPALRQGFIVLCDRGPDSTRAYQGYARGLSLDDIEQRNAAATQGQAPDVTFLIDVSHATANDRMAGRQADLIESAGLECLARQGFYNIAYGAVCGRMVVVDGERSIDEVADTIWSEVQLRLKI